MDLCNINDIKALLARHGFRFSKSMGQNFLIEGWVPRDIAEASGAAPGCGVLEVGPGIGPLTRELSLRAERVVSVELDRSLFPLLAETLANLPYNITSPAITALLEAKCFSAITVMIQREVARRICAPPGSPDYGAFSVFCQYHAHTELLFDVPPDCFLPAPKVTSSVLRMVPKAPPAEVDDEAHFFRVVRAAFAQRRKTLANSLSASLGGSCGKQAVARAIEACGLPAAVRGERLSISEFAALSRALRREEAASTSE